MNDTSISESQEKKVNLPAPSNENKDGVGGGGGGGSRWFVPPIATTTTAESTFESLALDVSYSGLDMSGHDLVDHATNSYRETRDDRRRGSIRKDDIQKKINKINDKEDDLLWDDIGVVEYLERKLGPPDESTPEERVEVLKEVLAETDIHEGDGDLSDFLFHVARTKYGRIYIRVIRTLLLNRVFGVGVGPCRTSFGVPWRTKNQKSKTGVPRWRKSRRKQPLRYHQQPQQQEEEEESQDDDPYEYDEDIRPSTSSVSSEFDSTSDNYENEVARVLRLETYYSQTGSSQECGPVRSMNHSSPLTWNIHMDSNPIRLVVSRNWFW
ncbi:PREDICTED: uncharacterized protein LOC107066897 [Polistes dominula]|uniref:Uncharacterized protein LOC107066897 n=1 Tax=Polistes dominula TaxID=743375 RepID=A0ABM1IB27_POLDO|nr:PREDICTED: uncharacterized protein LOC107066897 [Polistes dominula]